MLNNIGAGGGRGGAGEQHRSYHHPGKFLNLSFSLNTFFSLL